MFHKRILLGVTLPFRLDYTVWALRRRQKNLTDQWDGNQYRRIVVFDNEPIRLNVTQRGAATTTKLVVALESKQEIAAPVRKRARSLVRRMFGLDVDLQPFYILANKNKILKLLVAEFSGVKPPRFPTVFEALVNAIACQQVTLDLGILLLNRLCERFGPAFVAPEGTSYAFPRPIDLARAPAQELKELGFSGHKARAITELAAQVANDQIDLSALEEMTTPEVFDFLLTLRGIGRWSAEYALLRGLGRLNVFPGDDVGAQNNLQRLARLDVRPNYEQIKQLTSQWSPYQGLAYFHLLLEKLKLKGVL